jgi:carotenoid 1,2-hydratase
MQIISDYTRDTANQKTKSGSYEWWYFDGITNDREFSFVIIFYEGNPFSRRYIQAQVENEHTGINLANQFPALSISVYQGGTPVYYGFCEHEAGSATFDTDHVKGRVGQSEFKSSLVDGKLVYEIFINQKLSGGDSIEGNLKFTSINNSYVLQGNQLNNQSEKHVWNLVQPHSQVEGELSINGYQSFNIQFSGKGYHDHNLGLEPMDESFLDWYWGRFHFMNSTFVYYIMRKHGGNQYQAWLMNNDGTCISINKNIELEDNSLNTFGLLSSRKILVEGNGFNCLIQQERIIDNGPFYQRFMSTIVMKTGDGVEQSSGITEYIHPGRIKNRIFWPLVNMRIHYPGKKAHWVQRNPKLYRWTW